MGLEETGMTSLAQLRKAALSLPEVEEGGAAVFTVRGKRFASAEQGVARLHLPEAEAGEFLAAYGTASRLTHGGRSIGVRVGLADLDGQQLNHWVRLAWRSHAPKRLAEQAAAADTAAPGDVGDLPRAIGRPATRALTAAGITTLDQVADLSKAELLAMHGVGPKAARILGETLATTGRTFKS